MALTKPLLYAILHVGASSMSVTIVEYTTIDQVKVIDFASRAVTFGEELFQSQRLSFKSIEELCRVLKGYKRLVEAYGVTEYKLYGTSVVREAENRRQIMDQIFIHTGMKVEVIDMPKETYYKYFALYFHLSQQGLTNMNDAAMFVDITSGGVGIAIWKGGSMLFQQNVHIGSLRVMESFNRNQRSSFTFPEAVGEYLHSMLSSLREEVKRFQVKYMVLSGDEAVTVAELMNFTVKKKEVSAVLPEQFNTFVDSFNGVTATKLMTRYKLPEHRANIIMPTIILYHEILKMIDVQTLLVSSSSFPEGVTLYYGAERENHPYLYMLREQNVQLAESIAKRYHTDMAHAKQAERFCLQIYDAVRTEGLSERSGYLLRMAAILCEVGKYVNLRDHSTQGYHIIMGTDIFGLSEEEKEIVANIVYYHYKGCPDDDDLNFRRLKEVHKIILTKLVAIMRIARALDASRKGKIRRLDVSLNQNEVVVSAHTEEDISLERWNFEREASYFREIFGLTVLLEERR